MDADRIAEAVPILEHVYAVGRKIRKLDFVGPKLLDAYVKVGRKIDAVRLVVEQLAENRKTAPPGSPQLGGILASTGNTLLALDPAAAEPVLRECVELREKLAPKSWPTANAKSLLGAALFGQRKYTAAEPLLLAGYAGLAADAASIPRPGKRTCRTRPTG